MKSQEHWNIDLAKQHYRIADWGMDLFDLNAEGHVITKAGGNELDLYELSKHLESANITLPVLVRFPHILQQFLNELNLAFKHAITSSGYTKGYISAYPIKVNQQASVIRHFYSQDQWPIAFEVGSKAELIACLGLIQNQQTIICNGYKDETYIRLALMGCLLGHEVIIVLEGLVELQHVLKISRELNVKPILGMRIRLSSIAEGNWQNTGGQRSKFGLTSNEVLELVQELKVNNVTDWMRMLHFHMGSQIPSLSHIQSGVQEGMRYFIELFDLGIMFSSLNVGGGLAVDYEGSCTSTYFSKNYSINDYASMIVRIVHSMCQEKGIQDPIIFSENGRAMTAYHAVLLTNVIDAEFQHEDNNFKHTNYLAQKSYSNKNVTKLIEEFENIAASLKNKHCDIDCSNCYSKLKQIMENIEADFSSGLISLSDKAVAETVSTTSFKKLLECNNNLNAEHKNEIKNKIIDKYFCNFSLFQSTPDIWGLGQIFPILPLHRLNELPTREVHLHDLTCDSDGQIDYYVEDNSVKSYISLHDIKTQEKYVLGLFLVGAYQEILGDMHNLFGDTNAVNIVLNPDGGYQICEEEPGDTVEEVLSYVHMDTAEMRQNWLEKLDNMNVAEQTKEYILQELNMALKSDSYLN